VLKKTFLSRIVVLLVDLTNVS